MVFEIPVSFAIKTVVSAGIGLIKAIFNSEKSSKVRKQIKEQISAIEDMKNEIVMITEEKQRNLNEEAERQRVYYGQYVTQDSATIGEVNAELKKTSDYIQQLSQNQIKKANREIEILRNAYEDADYGALDFFTDFAGGAAKATVSFIAESFDPVTLKQTMPNLGSLTADGMSIIQNATLPPKRITESNDYLSNYFNNNNPALLEARGGMLKDESKKIPSLPVVSVKKSKSSVK